MDGAAIPQKQTPTEGDLTATPFAELLLGLARDRFTGTIELRREEVQKRILFQRGLPVMAESNLSGESLAKALSDAGHLDAEQHRRIVEATRSGKMSEGAAVLALDSVDAQTLIQTLRRVIRQRLLECFEWAQGRFLEAETGEVPEHAAALRCDPVSVALEGIAIHWSPNRVREALSPSSHRFPHGSPATANLIERLGADADTRMRCLALDGTQPLADALADASPVAWSAALVLERLGAWTMRETPWIDEGDDSEEKAAPSLPEYDIVVGSSEDAVPASRDDDPSATGAKKARSVGDAVESFRAEIEELHSKIEELDHYAILGVDEKSGTGPIKRAYFQLAKRFHPDALARLGLEDLKDEAKEVFARIASAYETLKDPASRREYDANRESGADELDASRLIQAESLFRKGEILIGAGNFAGALEFLAPAVELWPEEAEYQSALGWALFRKSPPDLGGAQEHLQLAVNTGPNNAVAHQRLSLVLRALEDFKGADAALARAKTLDPKL